MIVLMTLLLPKRTKLYHQEYNDDKIHNDLSFLNDYLKDFPCTILFIREGKIRVEIELKPKEEVEIKWI